MKDDCTDDPTGILKTIDSMLPTRSNQSVDERANDIGTANVKSQNLILVLISRLANG
jgi:hypothetical protein